MIAVADHADGLILPVRAQPGSRRAGVAGEHAGALKLAVTAPPQGGRANDALTEALRHALGLRRSQVQLVGGATSRDKRFLIRGLTRAELESRLATLGI
jgi:uncharacterized protein (TIGR00251 family)